MSEVLKFDTLEPIEVQVELAGQSYLLKEASGKASTAYRNAMLACMTLGPNGRPSSVRNMANVESLLVSMCLYDDAGKLVPQSIIESWPTRIKTKLFETVKEISGLTEQAGERELLGKALSRNDSPLPIAGLRDWIKGLGGDDYDSLLKWLEPTDEEKAKNSQSDTTDGSP